MKIEEIPVWEAFYAVAKHGGFSSASRILRVPVPQLSKRVSKLEAQLGVRLFQRSTRVVMLTDEGKALLPKVTTLLEDLAGLEASFESKQKIDGTIRVTSVPFVAHRFLAPKLKEFLQLYPGIRIDLELSENFVNLIESNVDVAIRIDDEPSDSALVYRKLAPNKLILCASPHYLKKAPELKKPADLKNHEVLVLDVHADCQFEGKTSRIRDFLKERKLECNNGWFLTELALQDYGVLVRSTWDVRDHLKSGALVQVLKNHPIETFGNIYAVIPSRRYLAPRVRAFLDFLQTHAGTLTRA